MDVKVIIHSNLIEGNNKKNVYDYPYIIRRLDCSELYMVVGSNYNWNWVNFDKWMQHKQ